MILKNKIKNIYYILKSKKESISVKYRAPSNYNETVSKFINNKNLSSSTKYLIYVDTENFQVNIFVGSKNNWILDKNYICSIGKPSTPTPKGFFKIGAKGYSFGENHGYICYYYSQFKGNYLFHSILYNLDNTIRDGRLGCKISNGCIRLSKINAKWIYDNIPYGTTVYIV
ncbi:L,D-transpeptidase [Clostridium celatum]|uniref:L,D-transpeptidase n=1 Tax=Clostridium celatum TaxID=36834 RepID=UPI00319DE92F